MDIYDMISSICSSRQQNKSVVTGISIVVTWRDTAWGRGAGRSLGVQEMFYILFWELITWVCTYVKVHMYTSIYRSYTSTQSN